MMAEDLVQIRDPVHGTLQLTRAELAVVDHPAFQRLRLIKQLGFADLAYPGATHSRYAHALGTLHVASRMLESVLRKSNLPSLEVQRYRQLLRLAALFHDLGHAPLSHTTERFMPLVRELNLGPWCLGDPDRQATHEDYTLLIITRSSLTSLLQQRFAALDVGPEDIAAVIAGWAPRAVAERFVVSGQNWLPLLHQCVSSELDADRMDYLLRDSYFAGVPYGRYDHEWLLDNLTLVEHAGALHLGLIARATFSFEDYLLSRYHMFVSVYFHHVPVGAELMLERWHADAAHELVLPADVETYLGCDDVFLYSVLRKSKSEWARRVVERRPYRMLVETRQVIGDGAQEPTLDAEDLAERLRQENIPAWAHRVKSSLSRYYSGSQSHAPASELYVVDQGRISPIEQAVPLYRRYAGAIHLWRVYVDPAHLEDARVLLRKWY